MTCARANRELSRHAAAVCAVIGILAHPLAVMSDPTGAQQLLQSSTTGDAPRAILPPRDPPEVTPATRAAIDKGIAFLVNNQNHDGSWRTNGGVGNYPVAMTALSGMALLAAGNTPTQGPYAKQVSSAITFLLKSARSDGLIAQIEEESHCMHGHGFATLFLALCYGMEEDPQRLAQIRTVLQRAVELTSGSQSPAGGWLYTPDARADEGSVTVTQVQALRACRNVGIAVSKRVIDNAMEYLKKSTNDDGGIRYQVSDNGPSRPAITAAAVVCWFSAGDYDNRDAKKALEFVQKQLAPTQSDASQYFGHYYYAHLYMSQAMFMHGDKSWQSYYPPMRDTLVGLQSADGSWDGDHVGTTYGTAVALVILQLPYKNLTIVQR